MTCTDRMLINWDGLFAPGMFYVAITRVTDPNNLFFTGSTQMPLKAMKPADLSARYLAGLPIPSRYEEFDNEDTNFTSFVSSVDRAPISSKPKSDSKPSNVLYFDFETALHPVSTSK